MRPAFPRTGALLLLIPALLAPGCSAGDDTEFPAIQQWPSPNADASVPSRLDDIARAMGEYPLPVDEIEFTDGTRAFVSVVTEDPQSISVWIHEGGHNRLRRIARADIAAIHEAAQDEAVRHRIEQLQDIENAIDSPELAPAALPGAAAARSAPDQVTWTFDNVRTAADLPGAADIRWWPAQPSKRSSSAIEPIDDASDRTGIWALVTDGLPRTDSAVLQVRIEAERVSFEHSPGFWGAPPEAMYTQWRFLVDDIVRYEAPPNLELAPERGRYPYDTLSFTLGPGEHTLRWELGGAGEAGVYFWGLDTITFSGVADPGRQSTWGALRRN